MLQTQVVEMRKENLLSSCKARNLEEIKKEMMSELQSESGEFDTNELFGILKRPA